MSRPVLTARKAADYCGLSYGHFRNLLSAGEGPAKLKQGRLNGFYESDLDEWNAKRWIRQDAA